MPTKLHSSPLTSIVAVGLDGAIGMRNGLPWRLKSDLRFFKQTTLSQLVIMGRKTFDSIGGCLPGRENIVLSHRQRLFPDRAGCHHSHSVGEALFIREKFPKRQAFVIGGAQTYAEFSPYVDRYLVTIVHSQFPDADAFLSDKIIGSLTEWDRQELIVDKIESENADEFQFSVIELRHKRPERIARARMELIADFESKNHLLKRKALKRRANAGMTLDQLLSLA